MPTSRSDLELFLCYPSGDRACVEERLSKLAELGVRSIVGLLGRGHSSVVLEVELAEGLAAALKVLRTDSKRGSLYEECALARRAYPLAPRVFACGRDYIVMELVRGAPVVEHLKRVGSDVLLVVKVLAAGRGLDLAGVDHKELSRAHKHVMLTPEGYVKILDYESASASDRPRSLCRVASWLLRGVLSIDVGGTDVVELLRRYKSASESERRILFQELVGRAISIVGRRGAKA